MPTKNIYGYIIAVHVEETENGFVATCPGLGGVFEEAKTQKALLKRVYDAACVILEARTAHGDTITRSNANLRVLRDVPQITKIAETSSDTDLLFTSCVGCMKDTDEKVVAAG